VTGLIIAFCIAAIMAGVIIAFTPQRRQLWPLVLAPMMLGLAGYAWQGQPALHSSPAQPIVAQKQAAGAVIEMRSYMDANYDVAKQYLILADSYARDGNYKFAAAYINSGLSRYPRDGDLWAGLGVVIFLAGDGKMSPPAEMAFANARKYSPFNVSPDYVAGLADLFEGRPASTLERWQSLIDKADDKSVWKPKLESQLEGVKAMLQATQSTSVK
jgi:cytochrome c-type biogenesis protein CcmH